VRAAGATKTNTVTAIAGGTNNNQLKTQRGSRRMAEAAAVATVATATETATAIEMATVTAMTPTLTPSACSASGAKNPHHKSGRCSSLTG
jgi:hypothetical protein